MLAGSCEGLDIQGTIKYQPVSLYDSSSHNAQLSQLDLFSFVESFDESTHDTLGLVFLALLIFNRILSKVKRLLAPFFSGVN